MARNDLTKRHECFKDAIYLNEETYFDYLNRFKRIALSIFEWENLPSSMDARYLEQSLYYMGRCAFLKDETLGFLNTKANGSSHINIYGLPNSLNCYSYNFQTRRETYMGFDKKDKSEDKAIYVLNNYDRYPTACTIELYAYRLALLQRTWDLNIKQQKFPYIIPTDNKTRFSIRQMINQIDDNEMGVIVEKDMINSDSLKVLNLDVPYIADKLSDEKKCIWNEFLTFIGVSNIDYKRERLIESEGDTKNEVINYNLQAMLIPRQEACKQFNEYFKPDKPLEVKVRADLHNIIKETEQSIFGEQINELNKKEVENG